MIKHIILLILLIPPATPFSQAMSKINYTNKFALGLSMIDVKYPIYQLPVQVAVLIAVYLYR